jgi:hypothetical protein
VISVIRRGIQDPASVNARSKLTARYDPLVLILAGVEYSEDNLATANAAIREAAAISNPVAVAEFFHHVCKAILDGLFATNTGRIGILGDLSNHFAFVETNGRGMLHLHRLA